MDSLFSLFDLLAPPPLLHEYSELLAGESLAGAQLLRRVRVKASNEGDF